MNSTAGITDGARPIIILRNLKDDRRSTMRTIIHIFLRRIKGYGLANQTRNGHRGVDNYPSYPLLVEWAMVSSYNDWDFQHVSFPKTLQFFTARLNTSRHDACIPHAHVIDSGNILS